MTHLEYIQDQIQADNISAAIYEFQRGVQGSNNDLYNSLILLSARNNSNDKERNNNLISVEDYRIEKARIRNSLLFLLKSYKPVQQDVLSTSETSSENISIVSDEIPMFFIEEIKKQLEDEYKKKQRFNKLLSDMKDKTMRDEYEEELDLCDDNILRIEKRFTKKIKANKPQLSEQVIVDLINDLKQTMIERFNQQSEKLETINENILNVTNIVSSIDEKEIDQNVEDRKKADELLQAIKEKLENIEVANKREIEDKLNGELSTGAKLKLTIPLIPGILQYESDLLAFSAKEPISSWKDLWKAFFKKKETKK